MPWSAYAVAVLMLLALPADAEEPLRFDGRIEALQRAEIATQVDGVVTAVLFRGGERVVPGDPLFRIDPDRLALAVEAAEAERAEADANLAQALQEAIRTRDLSARGIATDQRLEAAEARLIGVEAALARAKVGVAEAELNLDRAVIKAPIGGLISRPLIALGAFVEAEAGPPLATIVDLDPVLVAYNVPYATRLETLAKLGTQSIDALLAALDLTLILPDGTPYPEAPTPEFASATVDPETGALTIWASVANSDAVLRPGMAVRVESRFTAASE